MIDLELSCRERPDLELISFEEIVAASPEATRRSKKPGCWPVPIQWRGTKSVVHIAPDAIFGLRMKTGEGKTLRSYFFLEIDRGTMTIVPTEQVRESDALVLAHQYFHQLDPDIRHAVLGNAGTLVSFRVGPEDAAILAKEFQPEFDLHDLLPNYSIYLKLMIDGVPGRAFSARVEDNLAFKEQKKKEI